MRLIFFNKKQKWLNPIWDLSCRYLEKILEKMINEGGQYTTCFVAFSLNYCTHFNMSFVKVDILIGYK